MIVQKELAAFRIDLGDELKRMRKSNKMTLKEASELSGISVAYISKLEHGYQDCTAIVLYKLVTAYGFNLADLNIAIQ